jgi:hypothetical protein
MAKTVDTVIRPRIIFGNNQPDNNGLYVVNDSKIDKPISLKIISSIDQPIYNGMYVLNDKRNR